MEEQRLDVVKRHMVELSEFSNADKAVAIIGEAAAEGSHTLQVFEIWVTMYIYFRKQHPSLSSAAILTLVKQEWNQNKLSIIQRYLDQGRSIQHVTEPRKLLE
jgi:hypothetical protein